MNICLWEAMQGEPQRCYSQHRTTGIVNYIHTYVGNPLELHPKKVLGTLRRSLMTSVGEWVYIMKHKNEVTYNFIKCKAMTKKQIRRVIKVVRSNGGEYTEDPLKEFCAQHGIRRHFTVKTTPQHNGHNPIGETTVSIVQCRIGQELMA